MKDLYKKDSANKTSCTSSTAKYQQYISWMKQTNYYCVTKNGSVIKLEKGKTELIGSKKKQNK